MKKCAGVPVFRVCQKAKDYRGVGATGYCVEGNQRTNTFCIIYKKWLCNIQLVVNQSMQQKEGSKLNKQDPKYVLITFDDGKVTGKRQQICAIYSCWHKSHQACLETDGAAVGAQQGDEDGEIP